jgi:hypothetical protein
MGTHSLLIVSSAPEPVNPSNTLPALKEEAPPPSHEGVAGAFELLEVLEFAAEPGDLDAYRSVGPGVEVGAAAEGFGCHRVLADVLVSSGPQINEKTLEGLGTCKLRALGDLLDVVFQILLGE